MTINESRLKKIQKINLRQQREDETEKHNSILHPTMDGFWLIDPQGRLITVNDTYCRMSGYSETELLSMTIAELEDSDKEECIELYLINAIEKGLGRFQSRHRRKDGTVYPVEVSVQSVGNEGGQFACFLRDITEDKKVAEALLESEMRYRALFENMNAGFVLFEVVQDDQGTPVDLIILAANKSFEITTGLKNEDVIGHRLTRVLPGIENDAADWIGTYGTVALTGVARQFEQGSELLGYHYSVTAYQSEPKRCAVTFNDISDRKRVEMQLAERHATLNAILESTNTAVFSLDHNYRYTSFNSAHAAVMKDLYQVNIESGGNLLEYQTVVEDREAARHNLDRALAGEQFVVSTYSGDAGHSRLFFEITHNPIRKPEGRVIGVSVFARDVTEQMQTQRDLDEERRFLKEIVDTNPVGIYRIRIQQKDEWCKETWASEVSVDLVSKRFCEIFNVARADFLKNPRLIPDLIYTEDREDFDKANVSAIQSLSRFSWEGRIEIDSEIRWVRFVSIPYQTGSNEILWTGMVEDITDRKRTEESLRASEARYHTLIDQAPDAILIAGPDRLFREGNWRACEMFGYTFDEFAGLPAAALIPEHDVAKQFEAFRIVQTGKRIFAERQFRRKDGTEFPGELIACKIEGGLVLGIIRDITERKQTEKDREKLQAQLTQAQKMELVGRLAGGVAHDFNNMLGVILGNTEMALEKTDPTQPFYAVLQDIHSAAERSADLTRQLLAFARRQTVAPKVLDLNETVERMFNVLYRLIGEDIELTWLPHKAPVLVKMDPSQIDQILVNLCVNARDAIADTGKITIEMGSTDIDDAYCAEHAGFVPGTFVTLAVSDNGCGMDKDTQVQVFEPFFTTKEAGKGTGLGLATVYGVVKQNNGFTNVDSEPGQGTTLRIYLPRHLSEQAQTKRQDMAGPAVQGRETILLVEDEPAILRLTILILEGLGYTVVSAATPGEAIQLAREHVGRIDLLMTDVVMPEMNGRDLAQNILSSRPDVRRLFMSGYTADVIAHHGVLDPGVHFIQKPFTQKDLADKLREVLEEQ